MAISSMPTPEPTPQRIQRLNQQLAENLKVPLTLVEVAEFMRRKLNVLSEMIPNAPEEQLIDRIALENAAGNLERVLDLLEMASAPGCLKDAILQRRIVDEDVALLLSWSWTSLLRRRQAEHPKDAAEVAGRGASTAETSTAAESEFAALIERAIQKHAEAHDELLADLEDMTSEWVDSVSRPV
jgi:hypothetical protein